MVKHFNGRAALDGVSLEMRQGEVLGLLGPNGAGKTTLVRTIMGRVRPERGTVTIFSRPAPPGETRARQGVGLVPQEIALYPLLTARQNLVVFGRYHGMKAGQLDEAVTRVLNWSALADRAGDATRTLSGGMKRRLNMAAGIIHDPRILLLDEPTVGVDPQSRERIYTMIEDLRGRGVSIIYTTHYMEEAERLCDRIGVIDHGRLIALGTREELIQQTIGNQREMVIECEAQVPDSLRQQLGSDQIVVNETRISVLSMNPAADMLHLLRRIEAEKIGVRDVSMKSPTLERVFLHLTGRELRE